MIIVAMTAAGARAKGLGWALRAFSLGGALMVATPRQDKFTV
jgi:hypothetical protein